MKAVIYARYSSDNQREESIEGQIRECTARSRIVLRLLRLKCVDMILIGGCKQLSACTHLVTA